MVDSKQWREDRKSSQKEKRKPAEVHEGFRKRKQERIRAAEEATRQKQVLRDQLQKMLDNSDM